MKRLSLALVASVLLHGLILGGWMLVWRQSPLVGGGGEVSVEILSAKETATPQAVSARAPQEPLKSQTRLSASVPTPGASAGPSPGPGSGPSGASDILARIRAQIERAKRYPLLARRMNLEGVSHVRFAIDASGRPDGLTLKTSSGSSVLDQEALATIRRAAPFPAYEDPLEIAIRFEIEP